MPPGKNDTAALMKLFGPQGTDIVKSGDAAEDKDRRAEFARRAHEKMQVQIEPSNPNRAVIIAGNDNWPLPIPLVRTKAGQWHFDVARGQGRDPRAPRRPQRTDRHRRLPRLRGGPDGIRLARSRSRPAFWQYAQKIVSSPGKKDGLYSEGESGQSGSQGLRRCGRQPSRSGKKPEPYHGYYFRILNGAGSRRAEAGRSTYVVKGEMIGGFALVAFPRSTAFRESRRSS